MTDWQDVQKNLLAGESLSDEQALALASCADTAALARVAALLRDRGHKNLISYSRKVFIPLTQLCRDVCHYCTFAQTPKKLEQIFMPVDEVLELCRQGAKMGCQEALFTLGERPELRYAAARNALAEMGYATTLEYVHAVAARVLEETGLLPHINAGCMTGEEIAGLRQVSASMGIMLESASTRLCEKGMPHYGSPDKDPLRRLETLELAGQAEVPFTSGILIGIGETRLERIESLLALRAVHEKYGHLQEVIVQNFRAKPNTLMSSAPEPDLNELLWTIAVSRLIFGPHMNIQAPPNLSPGVLPQIIGAGINDWGGVSPLTPDHVNPEAPWPHLDTLARETAAAGKFLEQRLTIYPAYAVDGNRWLDKALWSPVLRLSDGSGFARRDNWAPGEEQDIPPVEAELLAGSLPSEIISVDVRDIVVRCEQGGDLSEADLTRLFESRGADFSFVAHRADMLRRKVNGDSVSYVVTRNINYTNVCGYKCQFCAFSKGSGSEDLRGRPYDIDAGEIVRRCREAWQRGATEVCMQGGIHPDYTGQTYLDILRTVKKAVPEMHVHAFSPLEVWQGAETLGVAFSDYFEQLREAGLGTLPGTAAEILHDEVREELCPDKLNSAQWLEVMAAAHEAGFKTTATIMYGHIDAPRHWASHLMRIRELQQRTGGFTEFVPLPFVHMEAPMYRKGKSRKGPSFREAILMHAVSRLAFHGLIDNIQTSWVKMGEQGVAACLKGGANDLGGTLMNESITRAAGTQHGQEWSPAVMERKIRKLDRVPRMRDTLYRDVPQERYQASFVNTELIDVVNLKAGKYQSSKCLNDVEVQALWLFQASSVDVQPVSQQVTLMAACN
ncbi:MAG: 5-amino-6-(D-ribitylamino)uracil--L-tyrosine 4-hydroxyphenyl transferase CofH [Proteobacteria bacterium]|nr:5-amino-6-(D-ribitylamino)uracil--L-tyrosine 4-hydroxyphenyl transferase CofH [Pseudomonadota bacterium]